LPVASSASQQSAKTLVRTQTSGCDYENMKTAAMQYAVTVGVAGVLALTGATPSFGQIRTGTEGGNGYTFQYCVPPKEDSSDAQRVYCEGWRVIRKGW
jgi:hypothetical protein